MRFLPMSRERIDLDTIMMSGQCFSIRKFQSSKDSSGSYEVLSADKACLIFNKEDYYNILHEDSDWTYWQEYFRVDTNHFHWCTKKYLHSGNAFIRKCMEYSKGMVILKQDLWEIIVSFIFSQRRNIPSIQSSLNRFRENFGEFERKSYQSLIDMEYHKFPTPEIVLSSSVDDIQEKTGIGYRAPYVASAAKWFLENHEKLEQSQSYEESKELLMQIHGVGEKVANCVCLFGLNHMDSFPVDVWIQRVLDKHLISEADIESAPDKGFLQQIIFFYVINHKDQFI